MTYFFLVIEPRPKTNKDPHALISSQGNSYRPLVLARQGLRHWWTRTRYDAQMQSCGCKCVAPSQSSTTAYRQPNPKLPLAQSKLPYQTPKASFTFSYTPTLSGNLSTSKHTSSHPHAQPPLPTASTRQITPIHPLNTCRAKHCNQRRFP